MAVYDARAKKRERKELEWAKKASFVDEELCKRSALEMVPGASTYVPLIDYRSTTDGAKVAVGTTEGDLGVNLVVYGKPDPPTCW